MMRLKGGVEERPSHSSSTVILAAPTAIGH